jgi:hypothetical protein
MKTPLTVCAVGLLGLAAAATAQGLPALDANADGAVDRAEFDAYVTSSFSTMDANGDGYIAEAESTAYMPADLYASANTNGDDGISLQEYQAQGEKDWAAADQDGDGVLR